MGAYHRNEGKTCFSITILSLNMGTLLTLVGPQFLQLIGSLEK
jgi:hypothetical protein